MKRVFALVAFLVLIGTSVHGQQLDPISQWATIAANTYQVVPNIVYTKANGYDLKLDVITAKQRSPARPTIIFIHGGGWILGAKEEDMVPLPYLAKGMNVVKVEYRLASVSLAPAAVEDCRCALRWVYYNAKEYGFDTTRLVVAGGSAGGHLALMTGMLDPTAGFDNACAYSFGHEPIKVAAIVNYFGITDVADLLEGPNRQDYAVVWLGSQPNRMELAKRLSPLNHVRSGLPPIITFHGDLDTEVPYQHGVRLHEALDRAGVPNQLVTIPGGGHGGWTREQILKSQEAIFSFLEKYGILSRESQPADR